MKLICKKCGQDEKFYQKERYRGNCDFRVDNAGDPDNDNDGMYDEAQHTLRSVYYYCCVCHAKVAKIPEDKRF